MPLNARQDAGSCQADSRFSRAGEALRDAFCTAGVALLLAVSMFVWRTAEAPGGLKLTSHWPEVIIGVGAVFVVRLLVSLAGWPKALGLLGNRFRISSRLAEQTRGWLPFVAVGLAVLLPLMPFSDRYVVDLGVLVLTYVMLGWGLNIVVGLAGLLDLGYVAFYAVGAYTYALLALHFGLSFWLCLPLAGILAAFWGVLLGFPVLRLRGDYLAIVTLAFGEIIRIVLENWVPVTGGPNGLTGIARPSFFGLEFKDGGEQTFSGFFGLAYSPLHRIVFLYYLILALALLTNWVTIRLRRQAIGRAWEALREDEIACRSLGINTVTTKLTAFAIGAMFAGFAGSFYATKQGFISPESFVFMESAMILAIVVLGGMGSQWGVAIAAVVMIGGMEVFRELEKYRMLVFGLAMVGVMIWRPRGLVSIRTPSVALGERRAIAGSLVGEGRG